MARCLTAFFDEVAKLAGICPSCGHVFRLSDAKPFKLVPRQPTVLDQIDAEQTRIDAALDKLQQAELALRDAARKAGLARAKRQLRRMDAVFSAAKLDPHDVKVLFDPIDYIVFDGMSRGKIRRVLLLSTNAGLSQPGSVQETIAGAVKSGRVSFKTLRISKQGECTLT